MHTAHFQRFNQLPPAAQKLFQQAETLSFFLSEDWLNLLYQTVFEAEHELRLYTVLDHELMACLPMVYRLGGRGSKHLLALENYYSSYFQPVMPVAEVHHQQLLNGLFKAIRYDAEKWDQITLRPLPYSAILFQQILTALRHNGYVCQPYFCFGNWYLPLNQGDYAAYYQGLSSQLQNTLSRKRKKLEKVKYRFELIQNSDNLTPYLEDFKKIYALSWKQPEPYVEFMPRLVHLCAHRSWLRLGLLYIEDKPAAAQIWIVNQGVASIYKLAYDPQLKEYSAGSLLTAYLMQHVIDQDKVREVDYLTGDDAYKRDWMSQRRERWGIMAFNPRTINGLKGILRHVVTSRVKSWWTRRPQ